MTDKKIITINLPKRVLKKIAQLKNANEFSSRSGFIRQATKKILPRLIKIFQEFDKLEGDNDFMFPSICTVYIPKKWLEVMDSITGNFVDGDDALVPSRSELIRLIILLYLMEYESKHDEIEKIEIEIEDPNTVKVPIDEVNGIYKTYQLIKK